MNNNNFPLNGFNCGQVGSLKAGVSTLLKPIITNNLDGTYSVACPAQAGKKPTITDNLDGTYGVSCPL